MIDDDWACQQAREQDEPGQGGPMRAFLPFALCQRMLSVVREIQRVWQHDPPRAPPKDGTPLGTAIKDYQHNRAFPLLPGSHLDSLTDGPLEFVKFACAMMSMHGPSRPFVFSLMKQSMALLSISEFSDKAQFRHPCFSLCLQDVLCPGCPTTRTLDFGRDLDLQPVAMATTTSAGGRGAVLQRGAASIHCMACSTPLDLGLIESELCSKLLALVASYQQADLRCTRCNRFTSTHLALKCECSGVFAVALKDTVLRSKQFIKALIGIYQRVGEYFQMRTLHELADELRQAF